MLEEQSSSSSTTTTKNITKNTPKSKRKDVLKLNFEGKKTVLITGASDGLGKSAVAHMYEMGVRIILACRSEEKTLKMMEEIKSNSKNKDSVMEFIHLDLSDLDSVRKCAKTFLEMNIPLHALICNGGALFSERKPAKQQEFESTYMVNYLSNFLLVNLLLEKLKESAPARIILLSSKVHEFGSVPQLLDDPNYEKPKAFSGKNTYGNSKIAVIMFGYSLIRKLSENSNNQSGVSVISMHPGLVNTNIFDDYWFGKLLSPVGSLFFDSAEYASVSIVHHALYRETETVMGPVYFEEWKEKKSIPDTYNTKYQDELWEMSMKQVGL